MAFQLNSRTLANCETALEALLVLAMAYTPDCNGQPKLGLPFLPLFRGTNRNVGLDVPRNWTLWCPLLGKDGRCTDYAHRPLLCATFLPATDALCVLTPNG